MAFDLARRSPKPQMPALWFAQRGLTAKHLLFIYLTREASAKTVLINHLAVYLNENRFFTCAGVIFQARLPL